MKYTDILAAKMEGSSKNPEFSRRGFVFIFPLEYRLLRLSFSLSWQIMAKLLFFMFFYAFELRNDSLNSRRERTVKYGSKGYSKGYFPLNL